MDISQFKLEEDLLLEFVDQNQMIWGFTDDTVVNFKYFGDWYVDDVRYMCSVFPSNKKGLWMTHIGSFSPGGKNLKLWKVKPGHIKKVIATSIDIINKVVVNLGVKCQGVAVRLPANTPKNYTPLLTKIVNREFVKTLRAVTVFNWSGESNSNQFLFLARKQANLPTVFKSKEFAGWSFEMSNGKVSSIDSASLDGLAPKFTPKLLNLSDKPSTKLIVDKEGEVDFELEDSPAIQKLLNAPINVKDVTPNLAPKNDQKVMTVKEYGKMSENIRKDFAKTCKATFTKSETFTNSNIYDVLKLMFESRAAVLHPSKYIEDIDTYWLSQEYADWFKARQWKTLSSYFVLNASDIINYHIRHKINEFVDLGMTPQEETLMSQNTKKFRKFFYEFEGIDPETPTWEEPKLPKSDKFIQEMILRFIKENHESLVANTNDGIYEMTNRRISFWELSKGIKDAKNIAALGAEIFDANKKYSPREFEQLIRKEAEDIGVKDLNDYSYRFRNGKIFSTYILPLTFDDQVDVMVRGFTEFLKAPVMYSDNAHSGPITSFEKTKKTYYDLDIDFEIDQPEHLADEEKLNDFVRDVYEQNTSTVDDKAQQLFWKLETDQQKANKISDESIARYTGSYYSGMNSVFREEYDKDSYVKMSVKMAKAFEVLKPLTESITVYRGSDWPAKDEGKKMGKMIIDPGFVSTSVVPGIALGFGSSTFLVINVPAGSKVINTAHISQHDNEREIILPPYSLLKPYKIRSFDISEYSWKNIVFCVYMGTAYKSILNKNFTKYLNEGIMVFDGTSIKGLSDFMVEAKKPDNKKEDSKFYEKNAFKPEASDKILEQIKKGELKVEYNKLRKK